MPVKVCISATVSSYIFYVILRNRPNSMISRDSFSPPLTVEALNTLTFNVVPSKDIIPMVDDKARLYQNINCTAPSSEFVDCHSIVRTLCEVMYSCGSNGRPVPCECVLDYKYPEPSYIGNDTSSNFTQLCLDERSGDQIFE
jgi:lipase ATG15